MLYCEDVHCKATGWYRQLAPVGSPDLADEAKHVGAGAQAGEGAGTVNVAPDQRGVVISYAEESEDERNAS